MFHLGKHQDSFPEGPDIILSAPNQNRHAVPARDSENRTRLVDFLFCIMSSLENKAFSVLYYVVKVTLHYSMLHRLEIYSALELSRTALLGCRLAASCLREAPLWQLPCEQRFFSCIAFGVCEVLRMACLSRGPLCS